MFNTRKMKVTACALTGVMTMGLGGLSVSAAEASALRPDCGIHEDYQVQPLAHKHHHYHKKTHSQGDVNTAAILGAVAGAIIAKNT